MLHQAVSRAVLVGFLVWAAAVGAANAQERVATAGRVLDAKGKPVAGATVSFVGSVPPLYDRFEPADFLEVQSDSSGRFRGELLSHGDYSVWAVGLAAADESSWVSELLEVQPGTGFEIQLQDQQEVARMPVTGLDAWPELGPLRVQLGLATKTVHRRTVEVVDGSVTLPPRPMSVGLMAFVVTRTGELLFAEFLRGGSESLVVPEPEPVTVRVRDEAGNVIAGATIRIEAGTELWGKRPNAMGGHRSLAEWRVVATTDAIGEASVLVPTKKRSRTYARWSMMVASKRGYRASFSGFFGGVVVDGVADARLPEHGVLPFTLAKAETWSGRVVAWDGRPAAHTPIEVSAQILLPMRVGSFRKYATAFQTTTDSDGAFHLDQLTKEFADPLLHVGVRPEPQSRRRAPAFLKPDLMQPLQIDFRTLPILELQVTTSHGEPARNAHVLLLPVPIGERKLDDSTHTLRLDNLGRALVPVQSGRWQVLATDGLELGWTVLDAKANQVVSLPLAKLAEIHGTLLMDAGTPRRHISFAIERESWFADPRESGVTRAIAPELNRWLLNRTEIMANGAFTMRFAKLEDCEIWTGLRVGGWRASMPLVARDGLELDARTK